MTSANLNGQSIEGAFTYETGKAQRLTSKTYTFGSSGAQQNVIELTYNDNGKRLSSQVSNYTTTVGTSETSYDYIYDSNGNITQIIETNPGGTVYTTKCVYDDLGQLTREDNPYVNNGLGSSYIYTYDNNGNRTSKKTYAYSTSAVGTVIDTQTYTYGDASWGDRLTAFNGASITYDAIGNPLTYNNGSAYTFTWKDGRRLATATKGGVSYSFNYNDEGIRTSKTVGGVKHTYVLDGSRIVSEQWGNNFIVFLYDESGTPIGMQYRTSSYGIDEFDTFYFEKNLQGDIVAVYNESGTKLVAYTYDAWGNFTTTYYSGGSSTAAKHNPFRYRGYYYDTDLGLYYLNSRYYDSNTGRFINADASLYNNVLGYNIYIYCNNNPIKYYDPFGESFAEAAVAWWTTGWAGALAEPTVVGEIVYVAGGILVSGIALVESLVLTELVVDAIYDAIDNSPDDGSDLPDESEIEVDIDHIMTNHHPSGGKGPQKDKFPGWMTGPIIERIVREAYNNAVNNLPDSILKIQEGVRYYMEGTSGEQKIRIWVDVVKKLITTAFPK